MLNSLKLIFKPSNKDLRKRIYFTLFALFIFSWGTTIRVPGTTDITANLGFLELLNTMGGGALERFSIFALGVMPYITASIIMQLLSKTDIIPYFSELNKQGEMGRRKINAITRYLAIGFAFVEGYMFSFMFIEGQATALEYLEIAVILTAGTAFLLWLGDQITKKGLGNGISLIIMAGIISTLPNTFTTAYDQFLNSGDLTLGVGIAAFALFIIVYFAIVVGVVFILRAERRVPIQYANKTTSSYSGQQTYMPFKLNTAGVIPVIFASAVLMIPTTIAYFTGSEGFIEFINNYLTHESVTGFLLYVGMIFFFAFFYTFMQIKPKELSENLQKNAGYIPGIRPGTATIEFINTTLTRLTVVGATFLAVLAGIPIIFNVITQLPPSVTIGGTGLLIVVGVALETTKQLESRLVSRGYDGKERRRRNR